MVDQNRETSIKGIFACGNVLHVHDLVDFVSEEAEIAGRAAADYIRGRTAEQICVPLHTDGKIRYTVPQTITEPCDVTVYFRVSDVFRNVRVNVYDGEALILSKKKQKVAPGEMETIKLTREMVEHANELTLRLEEA